MDYLETVKLIKDIEARYNVMQMKYHGVIIWPYLRTKLLEKISGAKTAEEKSLKSSVSQVLKTLFYYNPFNVFKLAEVWCVTAFERRKIIDKQAIMRVSGGVIESFPNALIIEKPSATQSQTPRSYIKERNIVSESWILLFTHIFMAIGKPFRQKIEGDDVLFKILLDYNITFDYQAALRRLLYQKIATDILLRITRTPKMVFVECPYNLMGNIWSFHEHGIYVIELQHGVINSTHFTYNSRFHSDILYPDQICVFGDTEYDYMLAKDCCYCKNVTKTGLYFLEKVDNHFVKDPFEEYRKNYKNIILVAGQNLFEERMVGFVDSIAAKEQDSIFLYVPRTNLYFTFSSRNVKCCTGVNIYEYMKWCDVHLTVSSTTCLECQYFKKPTIFYDCIGMASTYYKDLLREENGAIYINTSEEFHSALEKAINSKFKYKTLFEKNTTQKIQDIINKRLFTND